MLTLDQIDLSELADLLDQRDYGAGYLDPATGEIYPVFDGQIIGSDEVDEDDDVSGFIALGGSSGRSVYRDMELFADWVGDASIRRQLTNALEGHAPMRVFRSMVRSAPDGLGKTWHQFTSLRAQLRALDFLGAEQFEGERLVADAELEERRAQLAEGADALLQGLGRGQRGRLVLLNGLPGVGKSTLARAYVATRPGALNLDIDVLRTLLGGPWEKTAELGRSLALQLIRAHLDNGHEVVVPQLIADPGQLSRFEEVADEADFVMALVEGASRLGDQPWQQGVAPVDVEGYRRRLEQLMTTRPGLQRIQVVDGDVMAALADLEQLLHAEWARRQIARGSTR